MRKIIQKLREKPEEERRHLLHILTFTCVIFLIVLWMYSLGERFFNKDSAVKLKQDLQPFQELKNDITDSYNN